MGNLSASNSMKNENNTGIHNIKCNASTFCSSHAHQCKICDRFYEAGDSSYMRVGCKGEYKPKTSTI